VIHAGLYYPSSSLKAKFCVQGKQQLYEFCQDRQITHNPCGKLIVATNEQQLAQDLPSLQQKAIQNGVTDTRILSRQDVQYLEPEVECVGALLSPSTGVIDSHSFFLSILADAEAHGATLALQTAVDDAQINTNNQKVCLHAEGTWIECDTVVNSAGLWAHQIASLIHNNHVWKPPKQFFAKGTYFRLEGKPPFRHLIYPVPEPGGLGVHATVDWSGQTVKFGPDVEWLDPDVDLDDIRLVPDSQRGEKFYDQVRKYWPLLPDNKLVPDYVGVRPKLSHPSVPTSGLSFQDFRIIGQEAHGIPGLIHLFGIESPGLTSSMAIADHVVNLLTD
jgi:L-2-hydroxyglutarate oxidase LhgO